MAESICPKCRMLQRVGHLHDGYDNWRQILHSAGVPVPEKSVFTRLAIAQLATSCDAMQMYIKLYRDAEHFGLVKS